MDLRMRVEAERFHKHGGKGVHIEWVALQTVKHRVAELALQLNNFIPFSPNELMVELTGFVELINDVKAGRLQSKDEEEFHLDQDEDDPAEDFLVYEVCRPAKKRKKTKRRLVK